VSEGAQGSDGIASRIDTTVPHPARRYDYWLGGKDNYQVDRESGEAIAAAFPTIRVAIQENRAFLRRAVEFLAGEAGVRQFLDIGSGLPTSPNVHEIAQKHDPEARVVYVDNDPIVIVHARAILTGQAGGSIRYLEADMRDAEAIVAAPEVQAGLDLRQPVGLLLVSVLHFVHDDDQARQIVRTLLDPLPSGSYLAISQGTWDFMPAGLREQAMAANDASAVPIAGRDREQFARFFTGLDLVPPGIVGVSQWRDDRESGSRPSDTDVSMYAAVARVP
jgi:hypothetical protein